MWGSVQEWGCIDADIVVFNKLQSSLWPSTEAVAQRAVDLDNLTKNTVMLINLHKNIFRINTSTILCKSYQLIYTADSAKYWISQDEIQKIFQGMAKGYF